MFLKLNRSECLYGETLYVVYNHYFLYSRRSLRTWRNLAKLNYGTAEFTQYNRNTTSVVDSVASSWCLNIDDYGESEVPNKWWLWGVKSAKKWWLRGVRGAKKVMITGSHRCQKSDYYGESEVPKRMTVWSQKCQKSDYVESEMPKKWWLWGVRGAKKSDDYGESEGPKRCLEIYIHLVLQFSIILLWRDGE